MSSWKPSKSDEARAGQLYDFAVSHPEGFTNEDAMEHFGWRYLTEFNKVARTLRLMFAGDEINLTAEPNGTGRWVYRLVGTYDDVRLWATNRIGDLDSRLETIHALAQSVLNATDGRSMDGRKARLVERTTRHLREQLADLDAA